jgi:multidrug efflux pump subunit AcrA (membrane-fusion protein)
LRQALKRNADCHWSGRDFDKNPVKNFLQEFELNSYAYVSEIETQMDRIKQTYSVTYTLANKATDGLFSGKNVVVTSNFTDPKQNFCVPYSAITGKSNNSHVFVVKSEAQSNEVHLQPVQILYLKSNNACVSGELNVGDLVVVSGAHYLKDGMHVGTLSKRNREGV